MSYLFPNLERGFLYPFIFEFEGYWRIVVLIAGYLLIAVIAYLLGSCNFAIILSKKKYGYDIRDYGSGNAGMTNMFRTFGKKAGILTALGDVAKAFAAIVFAFLLLGSKGQYVAGFFCIAGHVFPLYFRFRGGKGVIVSAITILLIDPIVFIVLIVIFALMFAATSIISASSLTAAFFFPMVVFSFHKNDPDIVYILFSLFIAAFIIAMHKDNITRLKNGEEKKFSIRKKQSDDTSGEEKETVHPNQKKSRRKTK